ncbi:hypothetical protein CDD83_10001 [Cordyceps sp. RAO-2017]|nr:hypothetical protein CDD83_10001 [Cordyceps sp. RAO-2017]
MAQAGFNGTVDEICQKLRRLTILPHQSLMSTNGGPFAWAAPRDPETQECVSCRDRFATAYMAKAPCSHYYCDECINHLFRAAVDDESYFPPKCCRTPIPLKDQLRFLSLALIGIFRAKEVEFATKDRTYCRRLGCSTFVPPDHITDGVARRYMCKTTTCTTCKGEPHNTKNCPKDGNLNRLLQLAEESGWKQCESCNRMIERKSGCNHITCKCKAQFCYTCGKKWGTCRCKLWDENLFQDRLAGREHRKAEIRARARDRLIRIASDDFQWNRDCSGHTWNPLTGPYSCDGYTGQAEFKKFTTHSQGEDDIKGMLFRS